MTRNIEYAIRAKTSAAMRAQIAAVNASDWMPFLDKKGEAVSGQDTYRTSFCIGEYEKPFTLIIQRTAVIGQTSLDLDSLDSSYRISSGGYIYRATATNRPLIGMGLAIARLSTAQYDNLARTARTESRN